MNNGLIQYQGGGYDGCFWEWNFAVIVGGKFTNIFSSGRVGCNDRRKMDAFIKANKDGSDYYTYPLDERGFSEFAKSSNAGHVPGVAKGITPLVDFEPLVVCDMCGDEVNPADMFTCGLESAGGIALQYTKLRCEECYFLLICNYCGREYDSEDDSMDCCENGADSHIGQIWESAVS